MDSKVKQEVEDFVEDKHENYLDIGFDIKVKVENEAEISEDWCIQNIFEAENCEESISFDTLKRQSLQTCLMCCQFFTDSYSLIKHNLTHLTVPLLQRTFFICNECPNFYKNKNDLEKHIQIHLPQKNFKNTTKKHTCEICLKTYTYKSLWSHIREVHCKTRIKCEKCDLKLKCQRTLIRHMKYVHNGERPPWRFNNIKLDSPVECPECFKKFWNKNSLKTHTRNCHSNRLWQCKICDSVLKCESYLKTHVLRVHYDDGKLHSCEICSKIFKSPRYLKVHMKNSHSSKAKLAKALKNI